MNRIFGFGAERIELPPTASRDDVIRQRTVMLARCLNMGTTVAFIGAGCSIALGYPDWKAFVRDALAAMQSALGPNRGAEHIAEAVRLDDLQAQIEHATSLTSDDYLVMLSICQRISKRLAEEDRGDPYAEYLQATFRRGLATQPCYDRSSNPYLALLELPIRRFVTTNYDFEIERAICADPRTNPRSYGLEPPDTRSPRLSFTQKNEFVSELSDFVLHRREKPKKVFHCHGRCDDLESIVSSEDDYQRWYFREDMAGRAFRQNLELLFGSNPIFFVGFSMRDNDLLHALRILRAGDPSSQKEQARSLFAILDSTGDNAADRLRDEVLLERYQVHVIPYDPKSESTRGRALCRKLRELGEDFQRIRGEFLAKPVIRKVMVPAHSREPYLHYAVKREPHDDLAPARTSSDLTRLIELITEKKKSLVVVRGYGGSGKSWRVLDLINEIRFRRRSEVEGVFFWSSYYADDWLTGLDRALEYFESKPKPRRNRIQRLGDCLKAGRHLVVFDGFERLLRRRSATEVAPCNRAVMELLNVVRDKGSQSIVILTTRLMPDLLKNDDRVAEFSMRRVTTKELAEGNVFGPFVGSGTLSEDDLAGICSLCDGHSYALALAAAFLGRDSGESTQQRLKKLRFRLSGVSPAHRLTEMIKLAIDDVGARAGERATTLLERISMFMSPIVGSMMEVCASGPLWEDDVRALLDEGLLFRVSADPASDDAPSGFTVHPTVRSILLYESSIDDPEQVPSFSLPGYTGGSAPMHPGSKKSVEHVRKMFRDMREGAERALELGDRRRALELCRGAFGLVRSRMEANGVCRWTTYDDYLDSFTLPLAILAKRTAPDTWDYMDRSHAPAKERPDAPLYADELAWLWNDIGLAFFSQGAMTDSHAVFELSYEVDHVTDSYEDGGQYLVQSRLHMAAAFIQMGRLGTAADYLADTEESNRTFRDDEYAGRILGYKALLAHLRGNTDEADRMYADAVETLERNGPNLRGRSIFTQHHADLKMHIGELDAAEKLIRTARALAEEGNHVDRIAYARNTNGHLLRLRGKHHDANIEYEAALMQTRKNGIRGLESDVLSELAQLALTLGDWNTARRRAVASLRIANELWLGLRMSHGLLILGRAMIAGHDPKLGAAYLHHAHTLATQQDYLLRAQEAEKELGNLGETIREI